MKTRLCCYESYYYYIYYASLHTAVFFSLYAPQRCIILQGPEWQMGRGGAGQSSTFAIDTDMRRNMNQATNNLYFTLLLASTPPCDLQCATCTTHRASSDTEGPWQPVMEGAGLNVLVPK